MVEDSECSNFSGGCFINLCEMGGTVASPKRKNALPDMKGQECGSVTKEESIYRKNRDDCDGKGDCTENRHSDPCEKQRKQGVVFGVDPKVDAYLTRLKKLGEANELGCTKAETIRRKVNTRN